jgi:UDP-3-O-acyl-N-acetylglucosamine deacetylase
MPAAIGTLSLRPVTVRLAPAEIGTGLQVRRVDTGQQWPLGIEQVLSSTNCTTVGDAEGAVSFVEHLLAALWAGGISDVLIETDGPEIPLYDGSAAALWEAIQRAGRRGSEDDWEPLVIRQSCELVEGELSLEGEPLPGPGACFSYTMVHSHRLIGTQSAAFCEFDDFGAQLAPARTFATAEQLRATRGQEPSAAVEALCLVVYEDHLSEQPSLSDAFARHKLLDLVGDLFLCGRPVQGTVTAVRTGHQHNHEFLRRLLAQEAGG